MPPTPPPDIDLDAWRASEDRILAWEPDTLFLTHFGPFHGARVHFQEMIERLAGVERNRPAAACTIPRSTKRAS